MSTKRYSDRDLIIIRNRQGENLPVPPAPKKRGNEESRMQCALINWWRMAHAGFGVPENVLFSIPNGGWRDPVGTVILKREGLRPGACDLFLAVQRRGIPGLFMEMKKPGGVISAEQKAFVSAVSAQGYDARYCFSFDEAVATITSYLNTP